MDRRRRAFYRPGMALALGGFLGLLIGSTVGYLIAAAIGEESFAGGAYAGILFGIPLGGAAGSALGVWLASRLNRTASRKSIILVWLVMVGMLVAALAFALREAIDRLI